MITTTKPPASPAIASRSRDVKRRWTDEERTRRRLLAQRRQFLLFAQLAGDRSSGGQAAA